MNAMRIVIIDDDPAVRDALLTLTKSVGLNASCYGNADSFLMDHTEGETGCLITDICLPGTDGMQLQQILIERGIEIPLIAMSAHGEISMAVEMVRRGAVDFIEKPFRNHIVLQRIREALELAERKGKRRAAEEDLRHRLQSLTPREYEILPLLLDGNSNKVVARQLSLSPRTVETHRANILRKMQTESVTALAQLMAQRQGAGPSP